MSPNYTINVRGELVNLSAPKVMGIINITPDSFYSGSRKEALSDVLKSAEKLLQEGADFLDVGGYSSRPGASDLPPKEEMDRILNPISELVREFPNALISVDTFRAEVASQAVGAGACIVNDISGGHLDDKMLEVVAELKVPYIAMHMKGSPQNMVKMAAYDDVLLEVMKYFSGILDRCNRLQINDVVIDPGFGFAKTAAHSFKLLSALEHLQQLGRPVLVGVSRKSMIYKTLETEAEQALNGTTVLNTIALLKGASILRVHDVREAVEAVKLIKQLN